MRLPILALLFPTMHPGFPGGSDGKESACKAGDPGSILGLGRCPGEGHGNPLQYSCLENPMDRGAWWDTVYEVARAGHDLETKLLLLPRSLAFVLDRKKSTPLQEQSRMTHLPIRLSQIKASSSFSIKHHPIQLELQRGRGGHLS